MVQSNRLAPFRVDMGLEPIPESQIPPALGPEMKMLSPGLTGIFHQKSRDAASEFPLVPNLAPGLRVKWGLIEHHGARRTRLKGLHGLKPRFRAAEKARNLALSRRRLVTEIDLPATSSSAAGQQNDSQNGLERNHGGFGLLHQGYVRSVRYQRSNPREAIGIVFKTTSPDFLPGKGCKLSSKTVIP